MQMSDLKQAKWPPEELYASGTRFSLCGFSSCKDQKDPTGRCVCY
jgi:hypothetical protein